MSTFSKSPHTHTHTHTPSCYRSQRAASCHRAMWRGPGDHRFHNEVSKRMTGDVSPLLLRLDSEAQRLWSREETRERRENVGSESHVFPSLPPAETPAVTQAQNVKRTIDNAVPSLPPPLASPWASTPSLNVSLCCSYRCRALLVLTCGLAS